MKTKRLYLRKQTPELLSEVLKKPMIDQMVFFGTKTEEQLNFEVTKVKAKLKENMNQNWVKWDVLKKDSDVVMGSCGFHNWESAHERAEIGYLLHEPYRGFGFMSEALRSVIKYGFGDMALNRIEAFISPENIPSLYVVKSLGFMHEGTLRQHYKVNDKIHDSAVYSLLKLEYNKE